MLHQAVYSATQKQRRLEVAVRKAKRELEYATDPQVAKEAAQDVRDGQAKIRELLLVVDLPRQSRREQLHMGMGHHKIPGVVPDESDRRGTLLVDP